MRKDGLANVALTGPVDGKINMRNSEIESKTITSLNQTGSCREP